MAMLRADIDKLRQAETLLKQVSPELEEIRTLVNEIAGELDQTWDGAASQYFIAKLRSHAKPLKNAETAVDEFGKYAKETADTMQEIDDFIQKFMDILESLGGKKK